MARWSQLYKQKKPVIFYWYDPQYLNAQYDLVQVKLPPRFKGCQDDEKKGGDPKKYACAYPSYRSRQGDQQQVREERLAGCLRDQQVHVDVEGPEHRREPDLRQEDEAGQGSGDVGQGEPRQGRSLAQEVTRI